MCPSYHEDGEGSHIGRGRDRAPLVVQEAVFGCSVGSGLESVMRGGREISERQKTWYWLGPRWGCGMDRPQI